MHNTQFKHNAQFKHTRHAFSNNLHTTYTQFPFGETPDPCGKLGISYVQTTNFETENFIFRCRETAGPQRI